MPRQVFSNNSSSILASSIRAADTTLTVASGEGQKFAVIAAGERLRLTLVNSGAMEIVEATARSGDVFTVVRARENTTALDWASGTVVEARLTAGGLGSFLQNTGTGTNALALGTSAAATGTNGVAVGQNTVSTDNVAIGDRARAQGSEYTISVGRLTNDISQLTVYPTDGQTAIPGERFRNAASDRTYVVTRYGTLPLSPPATVWGTRTTGSSGFLIHTGVNNEALSGVAIGDAALVSSSGVAIGSSSTGGHAGVAIGLSATSGPSGVAIGPYAVTLSGVAAGSDAVGAGLESTVVGRRAYSPAHRAVVLGRRAASYVNDSFVVTAVPVIQRKVGPYTGEESPGVWYEGAQNLITFEAVLATTAVELGEGVAWAPSTVYQDGDIVRPPTANGWHYVCQVWDYVPGINNTITSGFSLNFYPGFSSYEDANSWVAFDVSDGVTIRVPDATTFFPLKVGFICTKYNNVSSAPIISVGTVNSPTSILSGVTLSQITGVNQRHIADAANIGVTGTLNFRCDTVAGGANSQFCGKFFITGYFVQNNG